MEDQEIIQMINIVLSSGIGINPTALNEYHQRSHDLQNNIFGIQWSLRYLTGQISYKPSLYALLIIKDWIINRWDELIQNIPDFQQQLYHIIFESSNKFLNMQQTLLYTLYKVQTLLAIKIYPLTFPEFFQKLFEMNQDMLFSFLDVLFSTLKENQGDQATILSAMEEDGSNQHLLMIILDSIIAGRKQSFGILVDLLTWVNPGQIIGHPAIDTILNSIMEDDQHIETINSIADDEITKSYSIQQESPREKALKILDGLLGAPMSPDEYMSFIISKEIIPRLQNIETEDENILSLVACIYSTIGKHVIDIYMNGQKDQNYLVFLNECFNLSMDYLMSPNEFIAENIINFAKLYINKFIDPNSMLEIVHKCFQRYALYFSVPSFELSDFAETLLSIITKNLNNQHLFELAKAIDTSDLLSIGAFFSVAQHMRLNAEIENTLIDSFSEILTNISPPAEYPEYLALTQYVEFVAKKKSRPIQQDCFNVIAIHATNTESPIEYEPKFSSLLKSLTMKGAIVSQEVPVGLILTGNQQYAATAVRLIKYVKQQNQLEAFNLCRSALQDEFHLLCLPFIEQLQPSKDIVFKQSCLELIEFFMSTIMDGEFEGNKDAYLARAIASMWNVLEQDCLQVFVQLLEFAQGLESMAQLCLIGSQLTEKAENNEWIAQLFNSSQEYINEILNEEIDWSECNEFAKQSRQFMKYYFKFVTKAMKLAPNEIIPETIKFVILIIENLINISEISMDALTFVYSIDDEYLSSPDIYSNIQDVIRSLILCSKSLNISQTNASWRRVMREGMKIMARIYAGDPNSATNIVQRSLSELGFDGNYINQLTDQWRAMMERGPSQIDAEVGSFYTNIVSVLSN
ncbi:hypothetical protein TVAG_391650 [Trichomonas vaginalis G3]|uniref:Importin N-terminal domain-containing protein n=1 Tax=Trichomonas vaginalis (strain ATCC PRA-98 / G3) TaxID=412133 RepID=A2DFS8_TRIV3|nr:armadillo (ARM) repeat-containing protein family [Trichomonas vaginalis G3]EAY20781.1 hypothetical protein TVAG_391650 [Trichomonas vaginalis G3]KAI5529433.1 armadillo (ARM) repeat-containing protein family [Trichomonas vaginalis G3]|eukprot:XP_001581767.1 hypothetical protein [Trichomonas vaginalis G3]